MLSQLAHISHRSSPHNLPQTTMALEQAEEFLTKEFGDQVSVQKAFLMLGQRTKISPAVSTYSFELL